MSMTERLRSVQITPATALLCIGVLVCISGGVVYKILQSANSPEASSSAYTSPSPRQTRDETGNKDEKPTGGEAVKQPNAPDNASLAIISERDLFQPLSGAGASVNGSATSTTVPLPGPGAAKPAQPAQPAPPRPEELTKGFAYTGLVTTAEGTRALLENLTTKDTQYVAVGDSVYGFQIDMITPGSLMMKKNGIAVKLALGENKAEDTGSAPKTEQPVPAAPPAAQPPPQPQPNAATMIQPAAGNWGNSGGRRGRRG
ncbi:MAG: hypothetical protein ACYDBB_13680 [Armatimonadota bacterium]